MVNTYTAYGIEQPGSNPRTVPIFSTNVVHRRNIMESMIKVDTGVSKKAMDEVAEVVTGLFKAANDYDVGSKNLGLALKLIGKTVKAGDVTISHCNLTNTPERSDRPPTGLGLVTGLSAAAGIQVPTPQYNDGDDEPTLDTDNLDNKIQRLRVLSYNAGFKYDDIKTETKVRISTVDNFIDAYVSYKHLQETPYEDLERFIPKIS